MSSKNSSKAVSLSEDSVNQVGSPLQIEATCSGCGRCVAACPFDALTLVTERADGFGRKTAAVDPRCCPGCGLCFPACPHDALHFLRP